MPAITSSRVTPAIGTRVGIDAMRTFGTVTGGALTMMPGLDSTLDFTPGITIPIIIPTGTIPTGITRTVIIRATKPEVKAPDDFDCDSIPARS